MLHLESDLRSEVQREIRRGRVDLFLEIRSQSQDRLDLDTSLVQSYLTVSERLSVQGVKGEPNVSDFLGFPGVVTSQDASLDCESAREGILQVVREATRRAAQARDEEGSILRADLERRIGKLKGYVDSIEELGSDISRHYREKLQKRIVELLPEADLDEKRLSQELLYYSERSDIAEEVTRLRGHVERFFGTLEDPSREPIGKSLDFVCQEMNREINTILAKSTLVQVSSVALEAKTETERVREQVQNVE
jgi:uncharacterized protein (TIGR00255 family)